MRTRGRPRTQSLDARCLKHPGSHVVSRGSYFTQRGETRRFFCTPGLGEPHNFSVLVPAPGRAVAAQWSPAPECPDHDGSKVVRNGTYGKATPQPRQSYKCFPADGSKPHKFTPPLPRDHVHDNEDHCDHCDELRGVHRGETAVARRHSWSTRIVARGLEMLSMGASYSEVSRWALRVTNTKRTRRLPDAAELDESAVDDTETEQKPAGKGKKTTKSASTAKSVMPQKDEKKHRKPSPASKASRNAWHISADWVEAFSPAIYEPIEEMLRSKALEERARLDALRKKRKPAERPQVILIDDVPVYGKDLDKKGRTRRDAGYYVLVVAELHWPEDENGIVEGSTPKVMLRLVRAMAKSNTPAWRLVFDELGYDPDFVVADAGTGIAAAVRAHFDPKKTKFIPSLWHLAQKVELALADVPGALTTTPSGRELIEPLRDHVRKLSRHSGVLESAKTWIAWWDELFAILKAQGLPADALSTRRRNYEAAMKAVLPDIARHPGIPVSTGGLETLIARQVKPLLAMRRTSFANIERTNLLFDLVVARQHGAFDNLGEVAKLLRADTEQHQGYAVPLRAIADPRPRGATYSSLRDTTLLSKLADERGLG